MHGDIPVVGTFGEAVAMLRARGLRLGKVLRLASGRWFVAARLDPRDPQVFMVEVDQ